MADEKIDLSGFAQGLSGGAEPLPFSPPADPNALLAPGLTPSQVGDAADANAAPAAGPRFLARSAGGPLSMHDAFEAVAYARSARDRAETPEKRAKAEAAIQTVVSRMAPLLLENEGAVAVGRLVNDETIPDVGEFSDGFGKRAPFEFTEDQNRNVRILLAEPFISDAGEYVIQSPDDDGDTVALEAIPEEKLGEVKKFLFGSNTGWTVGSQVFEEAGEAVAGQPVLDAVRKPGVVRSLARGVAPVATMLLNALPSEDRNQTVETPFGTFNYVPDITGDLDLDLARMQDPIYLKSLLAAGNGMRLTAWDQAARAGAGIVDFVAVNYLTGAALGGVGKAAGLAFRGVRTGAAATAEAAGVTRAFFGSRIRDIAKAQVMNGRTALRTSANADVRNVFEEMGYSVIQGFATGDYDIVGNALSGFAEGAFELGVGSVVRGGNKLLGKGLEGGAAALRDLSPINLGDTLAGRVARNVATTAERVRVGVRGAAGRVGVNEAARTAHEQARRGDFLANAWIKGVQKEGDDLARRGIEAARAAGNHVLSGRMASELWGTLSQGLVLGGTFGAYQSAQASAARNGERWEDLTAGQQWWRYVTAFKDDPAIWGSVLAMGFLPAAYQTTMGRMPGSMQAEYRRTVRGLLERELGTMGQRWAAKSVETGFKDGAMYAHGVLSNADVSTFQAETAGSEPTVAEDPYLLLRSSGRAVDLVRHGMEREVLNALPGLHQEQLTKLARELDSLPTAERSLVRGVRQAVRGLIDQRAKVTDERAEVARHRARVAAENQADLNIRQRSQRKAAGARAAAKLATQPANVDLGSTAALPDVGVGVPRGQRVRALREAVKEANQEALAPYFIREGDDVWRVRRRMARIEREIDGDDARYFVMGSGSRLLAGPLAEGYSSLEAAMRAAVVYTDPIQPRPAWEMPRLLDLDAREAGAARMGRGEPFQPEDAPLFDRPEAPTTLQRPQAASRANEGPGDVFARTGKWPRTHKGQPTTWLARVIELGGFDARIERDGFRGEIMSTFDGGKGHAKGVYKGPNSRGKRGIGLESWVESLNSEQYQTGETYAEADERSLDPSDVLDWVASESAGMGVFPLPEYQAEYGDALRRIDEQDQLADLEAQVLEDGYSSIEEAEADRRQGSLEAPETTAEVLAELDYLLESDDNPFGETAESLQAKLEDPVYLEARRQAEAFLELDLPGIDREELARMARDPYQVKSALETLANAWARAGDTLHVDQSLPIGDGSAEAVADASVEADAALSAGSSSLFGQSTVTREAGDALHETPGQVDRRSGEDVRDSKWQAMALAARLALDGGPQADAVAVGMLLDVGLDGAWTPAIQGVSGLSRAEVEGVRERLLEAADLAADQAVDVVRRWGAEAGFEPFSQSQLDAKPKKGELSLRQLLGLLTLAPPVRQSDSRSGVKRKPSEMAADLRQWIERSTSDSLMNSIAMPPGEADLLVKRLEAGLGQMGKGEVRLNGLLARLNMRLRSLDKAQDAPAPNGQTRREVVQSLFETLTGGPLVVRVGNKANQGVKRRARVTREDEFDQLKADGFDPVTVYAGTVLQVRHLIEDLGQYGVGQFNEDGTLADWAPFLDPYDAMDNIGRTRGVLRGIATGNPMLRDRFLESVDPEGNSRFENEAQGLKAWADLVQRARDAASGTRAALLYMARESNKGKKGSEYENVDAVLRAMGEASLQNEIPVELVPVLEKLGMVRQTDDGPRLDTNQAQQFIENFAQQEIARRSQSSARKRRELRESELPSGGGVIYHGGGVFEHPDLTFLGSGEGAQAFGWGIYATESKGIAKFYRDQYARLRGSVDPSWRSKRRWYESYSEKLRVTETGARIDLKSTLGPGVLGTSLEDSFLGRLERETGVSREDAASRLRGAKPIDPADWLQDPEGVMDAAVQILVGPEGTDVASKVRRFLEARLKRTLGERESPLRSHKRAHEKIAELVGSDGSSDVAAIHAWALTGKVDDFFVMDDIVAEEMVPLFRALLGRSQLGDAALPFRKSVKDMTGAEFYRALSKKLGGDEQASRALAAAGVPGHRYATGQTRGRKAGREFNYVIYDTDAVSALARTGPVSSGGQTSQFDGDMGQLDHILYSNPIGEFLKGGVQLAGIGWSVARTAFNEWANVTDPGFENGVGSRAVGALLNRKETAFSRNRRSDRVIRGVLRTITWGGRLSKKYADPDGRLSVGIPAWVARANRAFGESKIRSDALVQSLLAEWQAVQQEMDVSLTLDESVAIAQVVATDSLRRMFEPERWMRRFPGMTKLQAERLLDLTRKIVSLSDRLGEVQRRAGILSDEQFESQAGRWVARVRTRSGEESAKERGTEVQDYSRAQEAHADPWDTTMNRVMDMRALLPRRVFEATREVQVWNMLNSIRRNRNLWVTSAEYDQLPPYLKEQFTKSSMPGSLTKAEADRLSQSHIAEVDPETGEPIRDSNGNPQMRPLTKAELAAQEAEKQRLLRERKAASMDQVMLSLWARQQRDATETPEEKAEALEAIQNGEPRKGRKAPMTPAKQKILNLLEDGYIATQVYRDLALAVSLSERQVNVLEQAVQEWKRVQTILAPRFWIANVFSSVLTNHATQRLSMLDFVMSMSTGQGYYAEAARGIDRYIAGIKDGSITTDDDGNVRVDPNTADYANMEVIAKTVHYLGGGTWHRTMPGGIGGVDLVDLFGSAGSMSSRHHNQDQAQQLASAVSDIVGKQAALVGRLSTAWHHVTTGGTPQDRADAQMAVFAAHQQFELFFKLAATLAALRQQPVMSRAGVPVPLDVRVRRAVSLGAEGTVNYAARNDLVARFSQTIRLGLTVREKNAAREAGSNDLRTFRIAGEKGFLWAKKAGRFSAGFLMSRPFLSYQAGMLPTMAMAAATRPFGAVVGTWALLLGAQWWLGADEEQERRRNRDLAGQRGGHGITKVPPAELTPLQDPKVLANLRERFPGVPVNLHALADVSGMTQKSRMTIDEIATFLESYGGAGPFNPNLGRYESVLRLGQEGFVDASNYLDAFSAPARFNGRFQELNKARTEGRWDLLFTNDTPFGTAPALGQGWLHAAFLAMNGRGDQSRTESLIRAAKQVGRDVIPGITGAWPLSPSFGLRTIEDHMDATLEDAVQGINRIAAMARTERERNTAAGFQLFFPVRTTSDRAIVSNRSAAEVFDRAILGMRPGPQQDFAPYEKGAKEFHRSLMQQLERTSRDAYAVFLQQRSLSTYDQILNAAMDVAPDMKIADGRFAMVDAPQSSLGKFMQTQMGDDPIANDLRLEMLRQVMVGSSWNRARDAVIGAAERRILGAGEVARYFSAAMQFSQAEMVDWIDAEINKRENTDSSQMVALWAILEQMSDVTGRSAKVRQKLLEQFGRTAESSPFWAGNETGEDVLRIREAGINKLSTRPEAPDIYPIMSKALEAADQ